LIFSIIKALIFFHPTAPLTLSLYPHLNPPPSRGRKFLFISKVFPSPLAGEGRVRGHISIFSHLPPQGGRVREGMMSLYLFPFY
jgi:hypothetical protein